MEQNVMKLENAKIVVSYPEISLVLMWQSWHCYTDIDFDALEYLVQNSSRILLPNVKELTKEKKDLLKVFKGTLIIGVYDSL